MNLDHHVLLRIEQIMSELEIKYMLLNEDGEMILPAGSSHRFNLPDKFLKNAREPFVYGDYTLISDGTEHPLYLCINGDSNEVSACARLAMRMIEMVMKVDLPSANAEDVLRAILKEEIKGSELEALAAMHSIELESERCVIALHLNDLDTEIAYNILENMSSPDDGDLIVEMDKYTLALIKAIDKKTEYSDMEQLGQALQSSFYVETSRPVFIGIGDPVDQIGDLSQSYKQARTAIDVGHMYRKDEQVFVFRNLLMERFLADVPVDIASKYSRSLFNHSSTRILNEEMLNTINKFFENNLNLSETARQLYIHRNTLVYRLDKIERSLGLDLRVFENAITFKLMMLLSQKQPESELRS